MKYFFIGGHVVALAKRDRWKYQAGRWSAMSSSIRHRWTTGHCGNGSSLPSPSSRPCRQSRRNRARAVRSEVISGTEREDCIEQYACATQGPQHKGGDAQQEPGGPCYPEQSVRRIGGPVHAASAAIVSRGTGCSRMHQCSRAAKTPSPTEIHHISP